jgi:hypothetical protein
MLLVAASAAVAAQDRSAAKTARDERLGTYLRTGQYADARRLIDNVLKTEPSADLKNVRAVFGDAPNMHVRHRPARFACEVRNDGLLTPLTVNGKPVTWLVDTGANVTMISDAEATRLGMVVRGTAGQVQDLAGGNTAPRLAVARRMVIGRTELSDVSVLVLPSNQMPWKELPPGRQGILGLPIAIALDALRWTRAGICFTGAAAANGSDNHPANLRYDQLQVITTVDFEGRPLEFILDTGNEVGTQLWERFAKDFDALVKERGTKGTVQVTQIGGSNVRETIVLPDLRLTVGGKETALPRANIFSKPVGNDRFHGLLGMDLIGQANEITIDFRSMTLTLR